MRNPSFETVSPKMQAPFEPPESPGLLALWRILWGRKWTISGVSFLFAMAGFMMASLGDRSYTAESLLILEDTNAALTNALSRDGVVYAHVHPETPATPAHDMVEDHVHPETPAAPAHDMVEDDPAPEAPEPDPTPVAPTPPELDVTQDEDLLGDVAPLELGAIEVLDLVVADAGTDEIDVQPVETGDLTAPEMPVPPEDVQMPQTSAAEEDDKGFFDTVFSFFSDLIMMIFGGGRDDDDADAPAIPAASAAQHESVLLSDILPVTGTFDETPANADMVASEDAEDGADTEAELLAL